VKRLIVILARGAGLHNSVHLCALLGSEKMNTAYLFLHCKGSRT